LPRRDRGRRAARVVDDAATAGASRVAGRWIAGGLRLTDATASRPSGPLRIRGGSSRRPSHVNPVARARVRSVGGGTRIELPNGDCRGLMTERPTKGRIGADDRRSVRNVRLIPHYHTVLTPKKLVLVRHLLSIRRIKPKSSVLS